MDGKLEKKFRKMAKIMNKVFISLVIILTTSYIALVLVNNEIILVDTPVVDTPVVDIPAEIGGRQETNARGLPETDNTETSAEDVSPVVDTPLIDTLVVDTPVVDTPEELVSSGSIQIWIKKILLMMETMFNAEDPQWVNDNLGLVFSSILFISFFIVYGIRLIVLVQPKNSAIKKFSPNISVLFIISILLTGAYLAVYDMTRTVLDVANASFEKEGGASDITLELYGKVAESGVDVTGSSICNSGNRMDAWRCEGLIEIAEDKRLEKLSYPKVDDHIWNVNGINISPRCMEEVWGSVDNYQEYEEQYPQAKKFRNYPGQYWGNLIPIEPINTSWGTSYPLLSLPKTLSSCNKIGPEHSTSINGNLSSLTVQDDSIQGNEDKNYTLIAEWGAKECSKLVPHFTNNCQSLAFVKLDVSYRYPDIQRNTYAHITDNGQAYIVPVTTLMPLEDVIDLIKNN